MSLLRLPPPRWWSRAAVESYMALGHTDAGATFMVVCDAGEEAEPKWVLQDVLADYDVLSGFDDFRRFSIADHPAATGYEWMMLYADKEPYAPWRSISGTDPAQAEARREEMRIFAEEAFLNLLADVKARRVVPLKRAYYRDRRGEAALDITRCVFDKPTMLDFFRRIGCYGSKIGNLLAERENEPHEPVEPGLGSATTITPPEASSQPASDPNRFAEWVFARHDTGKTFDELYTAALDDKGLGTFTRDQFIVEGWEGVYETKVGRPPATGWPLRESFKSRAKAKDR
jgi:hypothetical protein